MTAIPRSKYVFDQKSIGFGDHHGVTDAFLKRPKDKFKDWAWDSFAKEVCDALNAVEELGRDAARYRWMRESGESDTYVMQGCDFKGLCMEGLDKAIDAKLAKADK